MISFSEPVLADKSRVDEILYNADYRACDYCFGNIFIWRKKYRVQIAIEDSTLYVRLGSPIGPRYLFPAGGSNLENAVAVLYRDAEKLGARFEMVAVTSAMREKLEQLFPGKFEFAQDRVNFDYVYDSENLITLSGKKYHGKRNHVTRFKADGDWSFEEITPENIEECVRMSEIWCRENGCGGDPSLRAEYCAVAQAFQNYTALGFSGGLLRKKGNVVAFSMGERLCLDTFVVHIEKAFSSVEGAYPAINQEFSARFCATYRYINREDDTGDEGLRKSKLSYHPSILLEKYIASLKPGEKL